MKSCQSLLCSTQQPALRAAVSPSCLPVPVWRISAQRHSLSATGPRAPATTSPISTASGSPLWTPTRSLSIRLRRRPWREARNAPKSADAKSAASSCSRRRRRWMEGGRGGEILTPQRRNKKRSVEDGWMRSTKTRTCDWLTMSPFSFITGAFRIESNNLKRPHF